jgi:apolipoprotein N-acyltransferase
MVTAQAVLYLAASLLNLLLCFLGPYPLTDIHFGDAPYFAVLALHFLWGLLLLVSLKRRSEKKLILQSRVPEFLVSLTVLLFFFSYIYALNANMDYVQRFTAESGNLRLGQDTREERIIVLIRYMPLIFAGVFAYFCPRLARNRLPGSLMQPPKAVRLWALLLILLSASLAAFSFPSFLSLDGFPVLAYIALVPLFIVIRAAPYGWGVFYGVVFGVFKTLIINYWLGTYDLVSLTIVIIGFLLIYILFMLPAVWLYKHLRGGRFLVFPLAWVAFDYLRSIGFLGYPWGGLGTSQYSILPLIQLASVTGIWGVTFVVVLVNSGISEAFYNGLVRRSGGKDSGQTGLYPLYISMAVLLLSFIGGSLLLWQWESRSSREEGRVVRVALIQQNSDPRKHDYRRTLSSLTALSNRAIVSDPDLVVWSETAFPPNISRWSLVDPKDHPYARLVHELLDHQKSLRTWLLTGNDDYTRIRDESGKEIRTDYNAAILFSPEGERVRTYHKMHLVPFSEYFPYKKTFPKFYEMLKTFDVTFWAPGEQRIIFDHPLFSFAVPICYEDIFPSDIRRFVKDGAEVLVTISNDYWSLTEIEAKQHFIISLFRTVENRIPLLKASSSGFTSYVDASGRLISGLPYYTEAYLITDVRLESGRGRPTPYTRFGDWFPFASLLGIFCLFVIYLVRNRSTGRAA